MPKKHHLFFTLLLAAIIFLVYYDSFNNSFVYDDYPFIVENNAIRRLDARGIISNFIERGAVSSSEGLSKDVWRPFVTTSFAIDYKLWKLIPRFYHLENTLIHAACAILVYVAVFLVIGDTFAAFIASLVFAIHPAQTEAVTWASGRSNVLFLMFFLAAFIFHIRNRKYVKTALNYNLSVIFFTCSLLSKEMAIVLPLILILYDLHFYPSDSLRRYIKYYLPYFIISAFYILARMSVVGGIAQKDDWWGGSLSSAILVSVKALSGYVRIVLFPVGLKVFYLVDIPTSFLSKGMPLALLVLAAVASVYFIFRKEKEVSFYMLWFFVSLLPVSNIVPFKAVMAERFLYLPIIGFAALFGMSFSRSAGSSNAGGTAKGALNFLFMGMIVFYGAATVSRNIEWRDEVTFYTREALSSPADPTAQYNLGYAYGKEAKKYVSRDRETSRAYYALAVEKYKDTLFLRPDSQLAYAGLGNVYNELGMYDDAIINFRKALAIKEDSALYNNLAVSYFHKVMYDDAIMSCRKALALTPGHVNAYINIGNAYYMKNEYGKAAFAWSRAVEIGPPNPALEEKLKKLTKI